MSAMFVSYLFLTGLPACMISAALVSPVLAQERPQRGKVVYEGAYSGKQTEGFILFNQGPQLVGAITISVDFDGKAIRATYKTTGKLASGSANGLVEGDVCKLFGPNNLTIEADCTGDTFNGKLFQQPKSELRREVKFELTRRSDSIQSGNTAPAQREALPPILSPEVQPPAAVSVLSGEPPPKIASVAYQGTYTGVQTSVSRGAATKQSEMSGAFTVTFQFDGPSVIADFSTTGTIRSFRMTGARDGTQCKVFAPRGGNALAGTCNTAELDAVLRSSSDAREQLNVSFKGMTTKLTDVEQQREATASERAKREKERVEERAKREAEQAAASEARKREEDAERARQEKLLQSLPPLKK